LRTPRRGGSRDPEIPAPLESSDSSSRLDTDSSRPDTVSDSQLYAVGSRQVQWWTVHTFVEPLLEQVQSWPMIGTQAWVELAATDPIKIAALYDAARHHALRVDTAQQAVCDAGEAISAAENWSAIAQARRAEREWRNEHPWARWPAA
jgi:hypothetical protein